MNRVEIRGGVVHDAKVEWLPSGDPVMEFSVAVNGTRWSKEANAAIVKTTFVRVKAYSLVAEQLIEAGGANQGDDVYVLGELDQTEFEKADGTKDRKTRVTAFQVLVIRRRRAAAKEGAEPAGKTPW